MITWNKIFERSYYNLQIPNRQRIDIVHNLTSDIIAVEVNKVGGWDFRFIGHLAPYVYIPSSGTRTYTRWRRLYIGSQVVNLQPEDILGGLEIIPKLWIPDITVRVWEGIE
nr:hypothetical protein [Nostoc sp. EkiNYC01]